MLNTWDLNQTVMRSKNKALQNTYSNRLTFSKTTQLADQRWLTASSVLIITSIFALLATSLEHIYNSWQVTGLVGL